MRVTTRQLEKMRVLYESGESVQAIEQRLKISSKTIYSYINKHGWERRVVAHRKGGEVRKSSGPNHVDEIRSSYLVKVQQIEQLSSMFLGSLGNTPEELSRVSDRDLDRVLKGLKALKLATDITDTNFSGVNKGFLQNNTDSESNVLPINIEVVSGPEKS